MPDREARIVLASLLAPLPEVSFQQVNYERLGEMVVQHNLYNHVLHLIARATRGVEPAFHTMLQEQALLAKQHGLLLTYQLRRVLTALSQHQVRAIPLKGPVLSERLHKDISYRTSADLDVFVEFAHLETSFRALNEVGFKRLYRNDQASYKDVLLVEETTGVKLEMHVRLINPMSFSYGFPESTLWERATPAVFQNVSHYQLAPEDEFAYLCVHCLSHLGIIELKWLADLYAYLHCQKDTAAFVTHVQGSTHLQSLQPAIRFILGLLNAIADYLSAPRPCPGIHTTEERLYAYVIQHLLWDAKLPIWDRFRLKYYIARTHQNPSTHFLKMVARSIAVSSEKEDAVDTGATWKRIVRLLRPEGKRLLL
ncbi:MAG: nucleotidyltransferase family protein [Bacteroidota bacterium]